MQLGLLQLFKTWPVSERDCSIGSRIRAWFLPQGYGAGLRPMGWVSGEGLCLSNSIYHRKI